MLHVICSTCLCVGLTVGTRATVTFGLPSVPDLQRLSELKLQLHEGTCGASPVLLAQPGTPAYTFGEGLNQIWPPPPLPALDAAPSHGIEVHDNCTPRNSADLWTVLSEQ